MNISFVGINAPIRAHEDGIYHAGSKLDSIGDVYKSRRSSTLGFPVESHSMYIFIALEKMYLPIIATLLFGLALASPLNSKRAVKAPAFFLAGDSTTAKITSGGGGTYSLISLLKTQS